MKNVFFALAFMLVSAFTFASTVEVETIEDNCVVENVINLDQTFSESEFDCGFELSWDTDDDFWGSGDYWWDCNGTGETMDDIIDIILDLFF